MPKLTDYSVQMLGSSKGGLLIDEETTHGKITPLAYVGISKARSLSMGNSLMLCDKRGDVAGWG